MEQYSTMVNPLQDKQGTNLAKSHKLGLMRDILLPDIISGGNRLKINENK